MPRRRGGLPVRDARLTYPPRFAPQTRGSTFNIRGVGNVAVVCPADAGVYRVRGTLHRQPYGLPRRRGGLPGKALHRLTPTKFAPQTRGSTPYLIVHSVRQPVCPAQAGVYLPVKGSWPWLHRLPRTDGGLPPPKGRGQIIEWFAPHRRGSTRPCLCDRRPSCVCPAQAGVYRTTWRQRLFWQCLPRTRGDLGAGSRKPDLPGADGHEDHAPDLAAGVEVPVPLPRGPANHQPEAGGDGEQGETGPRGPHPRRLGGVPGGSGVVSHAKDGERPLIDRAVAGNSPVYGPGWEFPLVVAQGVAGKPGLFLPGRTVYFCPFQPGVQQDDALRLRQGLGERAGGQESGPAGGAAGPRRLLHLGNIRAEEASGARNDRGGLLELLDLVVEGDTLVVTHIDRLSRGLTHGLQVIEGLHRAGVEFRSLSEDFDTATATGKLQLTMVLAFSEWWRNSIRERSVAGSVADGSSGWEWQGAQPGQGATELGFPRPALGQMQGEAARRAGEPSGQGEEPSPEGLGGHDLLAQADARGPAGQVSRPPPPRRDRECDTRPQVRRRVEPHAVRPLRRQRRLAGRPGDDEKGP